MTDAIPSTAATIGRILTESFGIGEITDTSVTLDELGMDSLGLVEFALEVRRATGAVINPLDVRPDSTVASLVELVERPADAS